MVMWCRAVAARVRVLISDVPGQYSRALDTLSLPKAACIVTAGPFHVGTTVGAEGVRNLDEAVLFLS